MKCNLEGREYTVFGYKGKQVRDNIHSLDVARFIARVHRQRRARGEVYNLGGGKANSCSILEAFAMTEAITGQGAGLHATSIRTAPAITSATTRDLRKMRAHYPGVGHHQVAGRRRSRKSSTRGGSRTRDGRCRALPRLLYIGDVSVADTMAGEALLYRLLQFYPPDKLALICGVRPDMPVLPGVRYHHWGPAFPRLLHSRVAEEYVLWRAWRYYEVPAAIARIATMFKPQAILTISHVSGWLAAWQLAAATAAAIPSHRA